jgi:hypothetical protein
VAPKKQKLEPSSPAPAGATGASATPSSSTEPSSTITTDASGVPTEVRPVVKHVLSKEMQLYFEKITAALKGKDEEIIEAALNSLRSDPSLHQLLPYFTQFISDKVCRGARKERTKRERKERGKKEARKRQERGKKEARKRQERGKKEARKRQERGKK